ncbi:MAG: G8 domain-containing protein, partial [Bacteroidota bacterium]
MKKMLIVLLMIFGSGWGLIQAQSPIQVAGTPTVSAINSGNWTAPNTWGGTIPTTDDRILIPSGITVTVDAEIATEYKSIQIQGGTLQFATDVNTELRVEYIVSNPAGRLEIGNSTHPIAPNVTAKLVFADRGGTTPMEDHDRFAPGAVLMGPVEMRGMEKTNWTTLQIHPEAGANSLVLDDVPLGWEAGDQLVVAGTEFGNFTSDELVEISNVDDHTIQLTGTLAKAHKAPAEASDLEVHVANLSRNIKISSENTSVSEKRRGHLMFMHHLNVDMRYVELDHLGRTDKSIPLDDYTWDDLQEDPNYDPPEGAFTNPRGRYSVHFHRGGFDPALTPAYVEGVTVNNDPGWGFTNHSSRVDFVRNVAYDVLGSAFCTESGDETGSFIENIALRTVNPIDPLADTGSELALIDIREEFQDFAWQGCAYWFHSAGVSIVGNVAAGVSGH